MDKHHKRKSLKNSMEEKNKNLHPFSARKEKRNSNFDINASFLREYKLENGFEIEDDVLKEMTYKFSLWEKYFVFSLDSGYEEFREKVIWLGYDEILEMYIENLVHPLVKPYWQTEDNYSFFINMILPQINAIEQSVPLLECESDRGET